MPYDALQEPAAPWVAINTHPHREHLALDNLERQGFGVYCPMIRKRLSHARRVTTVLRPFFPNYLFVSTQVNFGQWRPILSTYGVRTIVRSGQQLSMIDDAFITSLRAREVDGAIVRPSVPYQVGQSVRIAGGPFDRLVATIIEMDEKNRLVLLLELMNRSTKVKVSSDLVRPA